ncbi:hypothetical protein [Streptomyces sp. NPDC056632]|uniref:hypothetical protein n=1 Tax=Streptomyces sp. NPDC056632 TaxID=3345884 RepID=UPI00369E2C8D
MRRTEINGIPLYWDDVPGPFTAHLLLATGIEHEPFPRRGVTALAEQLALAAADDAGSACDELGSTVEGDHTRLWVTGAPERVAEVVNRLCRALAEPPVDGLAGAVRRVGARQRREARWEEFQERELGFRYGLRGPGRAGWAAMAVEHVGADAVRAWAASPGPGRPSCSPVRPRRPSTRACRTDHAPSGPRWSPCPEPRAAGWRRPTRTAST